MYNNGKTDFWTTREERGDFQLVSRYVMENLTAGARVLDFGCYTGDLLTLLNDKPYEKYGVELNRGAAEMARTKTGAQVVDSLEQLPEVLRFDSILAVDVIEHLPDPLALIRSLLGRLKDGGTLLITTGDGENWFWNVAGSGWWYCALPEHIAFISKKWLEEREQKHREPWHVVECRKFAYQRLTLGAWASSAVRAVLLAAFGENYLASMSRLKQIVGRGGALNVGGGGLLKDHLFVVLRAIKVTNQP
jgi:SAM-dependent methyltransferase